MKNGEQVIGTARLSWGGVPTALNERIVDQYDLQPFLDAVPHEHVAVGERLMFSPEYRGGPLLFKFVSESLTEFREMGIQLFFGDCEPHLLNSYQSLGYRPYTRQHVNKPETGYLIPIVFVTGDLEYLKSIGSPLAGVLATDGADPGGTGRTRGPDGRQQIDPQLPAGLQGDEWAMLQERIREVGFQELSLFSGMSADEIEACLQKSVRIDCQRGDILIKEGNPAKNLYAVIRGTSRCGPGMKSWPCDRRATSSVKLPSSWDSRERWMWSRRPTMWRSYRSARPRFES